MIAWFAAHPWLSFALLWLALGCWVIGWLYAATPYRRRPNAMRIGSRWGGRDAE